MGAHHVGQAMSLKILLIDSQAERARSLAASNPQSHDRGRRQHRPSNGEIAEIGTPPASSISLHFSAASLVLRRSHRGSVAMTYENIIVETMTASA